MDDFYSFWQHIVIDANTRLHPMLETISTRPGLRQHGCSASAYGLSPLKEGKDRVTMLVVTAPRQTKPFRKQSVKQLTNCGWRRLQHRNWIKMLLFLSSAAVIMLANAVTGWILAKFLDRTNQYAQRNGNDKYQNGTIQMEGWFHQGY